MPITAITTLSTSRICLNPAEGRCVDGILAGDYAPGTIVVNIAGVWTIADSGTVTHKLMKWGVVGYKKRVNQTTGAEKTIETAWDTSEVEDKRVPIWLSGFCIIALVDQAASKEAGYGLMVSATAGSLTLQDNAQIDMGSLAMDVISGDVFAIAAIGEFNGLRWGGYN